MPSQLSGPSATSDDARTASPASPTAPAPSAAPTTAGASGPNTGPNTLARPVVGHPGRALRFSARRLGLEQVARLVACAAAIAIDRGLSWLHGLVGGDPSATRTAWERRATTRLVGTLGALKGAFAKAGQFAAVRHDVLPGRVTEELAALRDRVPPLPFGWIRAAVEAELGRPLDCLFREFDVEPLGAASVAQVHRARLPSGELVAVKVQYPWLTTSLPADLAIVRGLLRAWSRVTGAGRVDVERIFGEFAAGLRDELDFRHEARVAGEIAANLAGDAQVAVPEVFASHSTPRVLTMRYLPAVRVDDAEGLARLGVSPAAVLEILARAYAKQVFVDGLFHADPHPGNLFVLDEPEAARHPRLLFVDFGLSRRLDPTLRREMRKGIYALLQRDLDGFIEGMARMDMIAPGSEGVVRDAVATMFERLANRGGMLAVQGSQMLALKDEAKALLQDTEGLQLPNDLLLYAKTLTYVFALGDQLAPEVDLMKLTLPHLLRYLAERDPPQNA